MFPPQVAATLPLQLTSEQGDDYTQVAHGVRDDTVALFEAYLAATDPPGFDPREWKLLKSKEQFQIFASRKKHHDTVYQQPDATSAIHESAEWQPKSNLLCIGSYTGSLDDAMYGSAVPTETAMMVRSLIIHDQFIDHKTLCDITVPTDDDPFTYVGLKWSTRPRFLATMVKPHDVTYVQASGFCTINHHGQPKRGGFHVYHSLENIPGVSEFTEYGFRRCRVSVCMLFLPTEAGTVDVFVTMASDIGGDLPRKLTTRMSAIALLSILKIMDNALQKKLAWLRAAKSERLLSSSCVRTARTRGACPQCSRDGTGRHPLRCCGVCEASVCARCTSTHLLVLGTSKATLTPTTVATCDRCLTAASTLDVYDIAILEFVRPFESPYNDDSLQSTTESILTDSSREYSGSFFGTRDSSGFFSITSESEAESEQASHDQTSMWDPVLFGFSQ